jgi:hypothetical protein
MDLSTDAHPPLMFLRHLGRCAAGRPASMCVFFGEGGPMLTVLLAALSVRKALCHGHHSPPPCGSPLQLAMLGPIHQQSKMHACRLPLPKCAPAHAAICMAPEILNPLLHFCDPHCAHQLHPDFWTGVGKVVGMGMFSSLLHMYVTCATYMNLQL